MIHLFKAKDKKLGVAQGKHRYDIPLSQDAGTRFLIALIVLMTFLACLTSAGYVMIGKTTQGWENRLTQSVTIEILPENEDGDVLSSEEHNDLTKRASDALKKLPFVSSADPMADAALADMVSPWLGDKALESGIVFPSLITVTLTTSSSEKIDILRGSMKKVSPVIHVDTHESWISSIAKLTGTLQLVAFIVTVLIAGATVVAIAGAMRMRMALHRDDIELLHLMGASNRYITKQFQQHSLVLAVKGTGLGFLLSAFILCLAPFIVGRGDLQGFETNFFHFDLLDWLVLLCLPVVLSIIAVMSTRYTVLRTLNEMP